MGPKSPLRQPTNFCLRQALNSKRAPMLEEKAISTDLWYDASMKGQIQTWNATRGPFSRADILYKGKAGRMEKLSPHKGIIPPDKGINAPPTHHVRQTSNTQYNLCVCQDKGVLIALIETHTAAVGREQSYHRQLSVYQENTLLRHTFPTVCCVLMKDFIVFSHIGNNFIRRYFPKKETKESPLRTFRWRMGVIIVMGKSDGAYLYSNKYRLQKRGLLRMGISHLHVNKPWQVILTGERRQL